MDGSPERRAQGERILARVGSPSAGTSLLLLRMASPLFNADALASLEKDVKGSLGGGGEDIIAGRNMNIPLGTWARRIAAAHLCEAPEYLPPCVVALEKLTDLLVAHGSHPEFNSPTYEPVTLIHLRTMSLTGEPRICAYSLPIEQYLWESLAWRWHPRLGQLCGPWARAYHDNMVGASGIVSMLGDIAWGGFYDDSVAYPYEHAHDYPFGAILPFWSRVYPST